jgi:hypothetical protein
MVLFSGRWIAKENRKANLAASLQNVLMTEGPVCSSVLLDELDSKNKKVIIRDE